jgi:hypothetical protein
VATPDAEPVPTQAKAKQPTATPAQPFNVIVDTTVKPRVENVGGFHLGDKARPVGRLLNADGIGTDIVTNEVQLLLKDADRAELELAIKTE